MIPLASGDAIEVTVEKGVYRGLGLARHEGQVVFIARGLSGERLRVRVEGGSRGYLRASTLEVLAPSPDRRAAPCAHAALCGGCSYQELAYPAQLVLKEAILREALARGGVTWDGPIPLRGSPEEGWRTRCRFHLAKSGHEWRLGLHQEGGRRVVAVETCRQLSTRANQALKALRDGLGARPGLARSVDEIELVESLDGSQLVACLGTRLSPGAASGLAALSAAVPWLSGLGALAGEGARRRFLVLGGDPCVTSVVAGLRLRSHVRSFFQANRFLIEDLVRAVVQATPSGGVVLDLYAGVGLFALPLAAHADRVLAAELNPLSVADARANAESARLANLNVRQGDVRAALAAWHPSPDERVVLDPPRTGAGREVVEAVCGRKPAAISYVSCDPPTLARDLADFARLGYRPVRVEAFDLFPDTFHLETLVQLRPA